MAGGDGWIGDREEDAVGQRARRPPRVRALVGGFGRDVLGFSARWGKSFACSIELRLFVLNVSNKIWGNMVAVDAVGKRGNCCVLVGWN